MAETTLIIAHRGDSRLAPENTLPAIEQAAEAGADVIALDIQGSKDHVPLVLADNKLERTTNGEGKVAQHTAKEIQALDAGSWFNAKFKGEKVPTLAEALKATSKKGRVMLSVPDLRGAPELAKAIQKDLKGVAKPAESLLVFTDSESLRSFREQAPEFGYILVLGEKVEGWVAVEKARSLGLKHVRPFRAQVTSDLVRTAHAKGLKVLAHFADDEDEMRELLAMHVDGIVTGRPARLKEALKEMKA
ncbi:MAG: hypothetical protein HY291_10700 [Planctomycetes bacterium]|nr:hypothetical protein [Planctomycetota bacterium]